MSIHANFCLSYHEPRNSEFALDVDLLISGTGVTAVFGPSGSGKSSLLRCIAGLEQAGRAELVVNGDIWQNKTINKATHTRPIGFVFQESSLFPHLTVAGNLAYAVKRADSQVDKTSYDQVVEIMDLGAILSRHPDKLSGGERQRVAIARAVLIQPRLLLMDEPLASLDADRKQDILPYLERLRSHSDLPIIYVTHSIEEVTRLADQVIVLDQGKVVTQGNLSEVFSRLELSPLWAEQSGVVIQGDVTRRDSKWHLALISFSGGELWVADGGDAVGQSIRLRVLARDVSLALAPHPESSILNRLAARISEIAHDEDPAMSLVRMRCGDEYLLARITRRSVSTLKLCVGMDIWAQIKSVAIVR